MLDPKLIEKAHDRIEKYIHRTPIFTSEFLNNKLGFNIFFKCENFQKVGAFKIRGALNALLTLKDQGQLPQKVVAYSSGNHAQGVALASSMLGVKATIFMPESSSKIKQQATASYGANLVLTKSRKEAEERVQDFAEKENAYLLAPFDNDDVILGQGTACYEALQDIKENIDAIFAPIGGGGLISGTYLAKELLNPQAKVFGVEPEASCKVQRSLKDAVIYKHEKQPDTIADGTRTLALAPRTFEYIKKMDGFYSASDEQIIFWTQWLIHLLKINLEPSCAMPMQGVFEYCQTLTQKQNILVVITGGNIDQETKAKIWQKDFLFNF